MTLTLKSIIVNSTLFPNSSAPNYYRAPVFGDIGTKVEEYGQSYQESELSNYTKSTPEADIVIANLKAEEFNSKTNRDLSATDIAAKSAGLGGLIMSKLSGAMEMFLKVNADDFTVREVTDNNGNKVKKAFFDPEKSDGHITLFSTEIVNGSEYLAIRDNNGNLKYFKKPETKQ